MAVIATLVSVTVVLGIAGHLIVRLRRDEW
jgi:hypothetical protein